MWVVELQRSKFDKRGGSARPNEHVDLSSIHAHKPLRPRTRGLRGAGVWKLLGESPAAAVGGVVVVARAPMVACLLSSGGGGGAASRGRPPDPAGGEEQWLQGCDLHVWHIAKL